MGNISKYLIKGEREKKSFTLSNFMDIEHAFFCILRCDGDILNACPY